MRRAFFLLSLSLCWAHASTAADAGSVFEALRKPSNDFTSLEGRFEQSKVLQGLPVPLKSSGTFSFSGSNGGRVAWHTLEPVDSRWTIDRKGIVSGDDGVLPTGVEGRAAHLVARLFVAMFSGEVDVFKDYFAVTEQGDAGAWSLTLTPKHPALAETIETIELAGGRFTESVVIREANGDVAHLTLKVDESKSRGIVPIDDSSEGKPHAVEVP